MTIKPHADSALAKYVDRRVLELKTKKSQAEIAAEAGFVNPNMITMLKQGSTKLALDRVPSLAKALDTDKAYLMQLALEQAVGGTAAQAIMEAFGEPVTANELGWLEAIRDASSGSDPRLTSRARTALFAIFGR
ncbi:helix-turn-helix domain-containing protein [Pseudooceanicola nanhaiensis]|uniref:helix-turn-helix domain-containing protein n=1 Tax=Pseudooceanicola nanhaiensis TaxID=375761 RepID=UPI001CD77060|nr:helix-turn-helix domain-containing protein [Pseudooceanicola nanhaiensis]MCA0921426.1 XRE family transcriptional regulator [Pseudooceanicola nanhaiensis]